MPLQQLLPTPAAAPDLDRLYLHPPGTVRLGMVASVDGAAVVEGHSQGLSGAADKLVFRTLRRHADVVLVGAGTARAEGYRPVRVPEEHAAARRSRGQAPAPRVAVVSRGRGLPTGAPLLEEGSGLLLLTTRAGAAAAPPHVDTAVVGQDDVEPRLVLDALHERGLVRVLCEGGPTLNAALLQAGLVDEVCATVSPLLVGGDAPRLVQGGTPGAVGLELVSLLSDGDVLLGRWRRTRSS